MPLPLIQPMSLVTKSSLKKHLLSLVVAAQSAKQTIMEKMRKQTRAITYNTYKEHEQEIMSGTVERFDNRFIYVNLGSIEAQLSKQDQIPGEVFASMTVSKSTFTRLKTTLVVSMSLLAVAILK